MLPTGLSTKLWRERGYTVERVEQTIPHTVIKRDLFGFADLIAIKAGEPHVLIQSTTTGHIRERERKVRAEERAKVWLASNGRIFVEGWAKRDGTWQVTQVEVSQLEGQ